MKCIIFGAGNAGRPVARILNHVGHKVLITDKRPLADFPVDVRETLLKMEEEGVILDLEVDNPKDFTNWDAAYLSPSIPENSPIVENIFYHNLKIIGFDDISQIIQEEIGLDIIGVTGTVGKTSTTNLISHIFTEAGYKVWTCSTLMGNLISETIVDELVKGKNKDKDIAILELPHGTIRLFSKLRLKVGLITNIYPEHLTEFGGSMERYSARKLLMADMCETLIANQRLKDLIKPIRDDVIYYSEGEGPEDVHGQMEDDKLKIRYQIPQGTGQLESEFKLTGYYIENAIAATTASLSYGIGIEDIIKGLSTFEGIPGRLEYFGDFCGRKVYFDAAYIPEGLVPTLELFSDSSLIVLVDNPDTGLPKDKQGVGRVVGEYAQVLICSGYNETTFKLDMDAAYDVIKGANDSNAVKIAVEYMEDAGEKSIEHSKVGDTILHVGSGAVTNYENVKNAMIKGIKKGCSKIQ
jgi:UDP-N-acetylmuramoylalanine--D-glutamate ligase